MVTALRTLAVMVALLAGSSAWCAEVPAEWLKTEGKGKAWIKATARCRALLGRLTLDNPRVGKYVPKIKQDCRMLRRHTGGFNWRRITAVEFLENLLADLVEGKVPNIRYRGKGVAVAYWSDLMNRIEAIWVHVPPRYDPNRSYQIFLCYKCGGGIHYKDGKATGGYRPTAAIANQTDTFFAWSSLYYGVKGRMGAVDEVKEAIPAICSAFSVDPNRVFLTGYSDGGFTSIWLAAHHPHLFAGIAPECANWQYSNVSQVGLYGVPMLVVDGWTDGGYNRVNFSRFHTLHTMGYDVAAVWGHHGHTYAPYERIDTMKRILAWAKTKRRNLWPKRVRYATWEVTWNRAFWFTIQRFAEPALPAQIDASIEDGNRIEVKTWNVAAYRLALSDRLVNPAQEVTVLTNGKPSYTGPFKPVVLIDLVPRPESTYVKDADTPGGIGCQTVRTWYGLKREGGYRMQGRTWLSVRPTGGDEATRKRLEGWAPPSATDDTAVTAEHLAKHNLYLYGGPDVNRLTAKIAADLPVTFGKGTFTVGDTVYDQPGHHVTFIHPNPLNPKKYVIVYAFNDAAEVAKQGFRNLRGESAWTFRKGDCRVFGVKPSRRKWGVTLDGPGPRTDIFIFDAAWKPSQRLTLGKVTASFDTTQMLRLRADAIREATGADIGLIWAYAPGRSRWRTRLDPGPVTLHDVAVTDMFPEYINLCDVSGDGLYAVPKSGRPQGILLDAAATTVLRERTDRAYDPEAAPALADIDPKRMYRVATNYYGLPAYGANVRKIPDPFVFSSPKAFLAGGHTSLPVRTLRQIPLSVGEAVAAYIAKRGTVAPRPTCFDLTQYLMNPEANEFGACDWLHLGLDVAWKRPGRPAREESRYTLNLGLRAGGAPALAPPRKNSKRFLDVNLMGQADAAFDFTMLDKRLPVAMSMSLRRFAIIADKEGKAFRLDADGTEDAVGRLVVVDLRLTNRGEIDVVGLAALAPMSMQRVNGGTWPDGSVSRPLTRAWVGFRRTIGARRKPPVHQSAALLVFDKPGARLRALCAPNVGYNFGLVAIQRPVTVKAGATVRVPLLFVAADKRADGPAIDLAGVLDALGDDIRKHLSAGAKTAARSPRRGWRTGAGATALREGWLLASEPPAWPCASTRRGPDLN